MYNIMYSNMNSKFFRTFSAIAVALLLAACTQDEPADGNALPEGKYPLEISSVSLSAEVGEQPWGASHAPQTRVAESPDGNSSVWQGGDKFQVQIGDGNPGTYVLNDDGSINEAQSQPAYWTSKNSQTITAWYLSSDYTEGIPVDLSNQSNGLAYVLKSTSSGVDFGTKVSLSFKHQLAKVRVVLKGNQAGKVTDIKIQSYTQCTHQKGAVSPVESSKEGWITMMPVMNGDVIGYWEANVVPGYEITTFQVNGGECTLYNGGIMPVEAMVHTISLTVSERVIVDLTSESANSYTVNDGEYVLIDGKSQALQKKIVINKGADVVLKNVNLTAPTSADADRTAHTIAVTGNATITLEGTNAIEGSSLDVSSCPLVVTSSTSTLTINGDGKLTLTGGGNTYNGCLGLIYGASLIINGGEINAVANGPNAAGIGSYNTGLPPARYFGTITINGGTINATAGGTNQAGPAAIGVGSAGADGSGNIIINGGNITAICPFPNGPGIGAVRQGKCGDITISGSNTVVKATGGVSADHIGAGYQATCGTVTIKAGVTVNGKKYEQDEIGPVGH